MNKHLRHHVNKNQPNEIIKKNDSISKDHRCNSLTFAGKTPSLSKTSC
jgi:hypothetical protein